MTPESEDGWIDSWMGEAVNWECDELGHLNMRHYAGKVERARQFLFITLGLDGAFRADAASTVRTRDLTICYLAEARPGARLSMRSGVATLGDSDATLVHSLHHADGRLAATYRETVDHIYRRTDAPFAWPSRLRDRVQLLPAEVASDACRPRGLFAVPVLGPDRASLVAMGASRVGAGVFGTDAVDTHGLVRPLGHFGAITESVGNFREGWPEAYGPGGLYDTDTSEAGRYSGVLLELRMHLHRPTVAGEAFEVFSGLVRADGMTRNLIHHIVDPVSGHSYASAEATSAVIDLRARKLVRPSAETLTVLKENLLPDMTA